MPHKLYKRNEQRTTQSTYRSQGDLNHKELESTVGFRAGT